MFVETSNKMEGVPFADCFTVDTKWRIKEQDSGGETKCHVRIWVKVNFTKSVTLVKGKIERNSIQGTVDYFKAYSRLFLSKFSGGKVEETGTRDVVASPTPGTQSASSSVLPIVLGIGFAFFFLLWFWYWWSAGTMYAYVTELEAKNQQLESLVEELQTEHLREKTAKWSLYLDELLTVTEKLRNEMEFVSDISQVAADHGVET